MEKAEKKLKKEARAAKHAAKVVKALEVMPKARQVVAASAAKAEAMVAGVSDPRRQKRRYKSVADYHAAINPYFATLVDPVNVRNVRIPDPTTTPSSTFSVVVKGSISVPTGTAPNDTCVVTFGGNSWFGGVTASVATPMQYQSMLVPTNTATWSTGTSTWVSSIQNNWAMGYSGYGTTADVFTGSTGANNITCTGWNNFSSSIPSTFTNIRLVSAALILSPTASVTNSQGRLIGASLPRRATLSGSATTVASIENRPGATSIPINENKPINIVYAPQDGTSCVYAPVASTVNQMNGLAFPPMGTAIPAYPNQGGAVSIVTDPSGLDPYCPGELWAIATGVEPGQTFQYTFVGNYEAIPNQQSALLVATDVSASDPLAMAHAQNIAGEAPKVLSGDHWLAPLAESPPITHHRDEEAPSLMDNVLSGLGKVGDFIVDNGPKIAGTVAKAISLFL